MEYMETGPQALARLQELIPLGSEVQTGSSTTLEQIGFVAWLKAHHEAGRLHYFRADVINNAAERREPPVGLSGRLFPGKRHRAHGRRTCRGRRCRGLSPGRLYLSG